MTRAPSLWLLLFGIVTTTPVSLAAQQAKQPAATPALRPAVSQWETVRAPLLNQPSQKRTAAAAVAPDLTSEWVAIAVVAVVLTVVILRFARD